MFKINANYHGIIDYIVVIFLWSSPIIFGLPPFTAMFTYILGGVHLLLTVFTDFKMGLIKIIPLKLHGWIELLVAIALFCFAFYLGKIEGALAQTFYIVFASLVFITWLFTNYSYKTTS